MKKILLLLAGVAIIATTSAQMSSKKSDFEGAKISNVELRRSGEMLRITMNVELGSKHMRTNCATIYTPVLYNASNEIALQSVGVYGRNHYFAMLRDEKHHSSVPLDWQLRHKDLPAEIDYVAEELDVVFDVTHVVAAIVGVYAEEVSREPITEPIACFGLCEEVSPLSAVVHLPVVDVSWHVEGPAWC